LSADARREGDQYVFVDQGLDRTTAGDHHGSTATAAVVTDSGARSDTGVLEITPTGSISDYYGNTGISSDDDQSCADLDGDGYSFSAGALAKAGVTAGGTVTSGGVSFSWPAICQPDNVLAAGQTILLAGKSGARTIGFLGTSADGATSGPVTVTYTDGATSTGTLSFSDWAGTAAPGENTAASIPYRNSVGDSVNGVAAMHIFAIGPG
jgi:hypothetical protein